MSDPSTACDLCGGMDFQPLYPGTIPDEDRQELERSRAYFSSSRRSAGHFPIVRCKKCGLVMQNPHDDEGALAQIYAGLRDDAYQGENQNRRELAKRRVAQINKLAGTGRLLDAGCSTGIFVQAACEAGWQATGLDPSGWAIELARRQAPGAAFVTASILEASFAEHCFDVITLWDVLEHVSSPSQTLAALRPWLKPGGWLALNLPDTASWPARLMGRRWVLLLREHIWYFTPATLGRLLEKTGFELVQTRPNMVNFSLCNIFARLGQYPGGIGSTARWLSARGGMGIISVRFPMGEMTAFARK